MFVFTRHATDRLHQRHNDVCGGDIEKIKVCLKPINYPKKESDDYYFYVHNLVFVCKKREKFDDYIVLTVVKCNIFRLRKYIDKNDPNWISMRKEAKAKKKQYDKNMEQSYLVLRS